MPLNPIKIEKMYFQLKVEDIERAKKFYEETFDFKVEWYEDPEIGWCEFNLPGGDPRLGLNTIEEGDIAPDSGTLTIQVENLEETKEFLEKKGIETTEIRDIPNMVSLFDMTDSEGNRVQIVANPRIKD
jgi:predicted enzyme related to lactoylglutathione lyase